MSTNIASQQGRWGVEYAHCKKIAVGFDDLDQIRRTSRAHTMDSGFFRGVHEATAQHQHSFLAGCAGRPHGLPVPYPGSSTRHSPPPMFDDMATVLNTVDKEPLMADTSDASSRQSSRVLSFDEQHRIRVDTAIAAEKKSVESIKRMARNNREALLALWHLGDGDGGGVMELIAKEIGKRQPVAPMLPTFKVIKGKKVIPGPLRTKVFERDAYRCVYCATHIDLTVDHIKPEIKGGTLAFENLQTLCRSCNSIKGAKE